MNEKYWCCWKANGSGPVRRHPTKEEAITEAGRLSQQDGATVYVLETVGVVEPVVQPVNYKEL